MNSIVLLQCHQWTMRALVYTKIRLRLLWTMPRSFRPFRSSIFMSHCPRSCDPCRCWWGYPRWGTPGSHPWYGSFCRTISTMQLNKWFSLSQMHYLRTFTAKNDLSDLHWAGLPDRRFQGRSCTRTNGTLILDM
jgi:hypothetical protein